MWKQKYKKTIDSIYPEPPETEISMSNVQKLTYYCQRTPDKLPKVTSDLRKRVQAALKKQDAVRAAQTVQIFQSVVKNCPEFLSMCEDNLGEVLAALSAEPAPEVCGLAADLFVTYGDAVSQTTASNSRMDFALFVQRFTAFATAPLPRAPGSRPPSRCAQRGCARSARPRACSSCAARSTTTSSATAHTSPTPSSPACVWPPRFCPPSWATPRQQHRHKQLERPLLEMEQQQQQQEQEQKEEEEEKTRAQRDKRRSRRARATQPAPGPRATRPSTRGPRRRATRP